ncbi:MAG TPA: hypothetical protein VK608_01490 [Edaphobacter sp.]|nr:hypothetical protein [Edaphobacter sp.]
MRDERMSEENTPAASMEERLIRALEARPAVPIPADFAARVASQVPAKRPVSLTPTHYGRNTVLISMVALVVALLALALHNADSSTLGRTLEWILCAQLLSLAVWFGTRHRSLS